MRSKDGFAYLPVGSREVRRELYVTSIGRLTYPPGASYPIEGHPDGYAFAWRRGRVLGDFALVFVEHGGGEFESGSLGRLQWSSGQVLLLPPGVWHRYRPDPKTGWAERWLCLNGDFLLRLRAKGLFPAQPVLRTLADPRSYLAAWSRANRQARENSLRLAAAALETVALALEIADRGTVGVTYETTPDSAVNAALEFVWYNCHRRLDVQHVADHVRVTRRTLERRFATLLRRSVAKEIEGARLERARQLLGETRMSVKEVGFAAGFSGPTRLIRIFRHNLGLTPGQYRAKLMTAMTTGR